MQNSVSKSDLVYADRFLTEFVTDIDDLYGPVHVTFSIHLLTHLVKSTEEYGQPWTHSAFIYESMNNEIKNMVKSSNGAALQITKGMQLKVAIKKMEFDLKSEMSPHEMNYLRKVTMKKNLAEPYFTIGDVSLLGSPRERILSEDYIEAMTRAGMDFNRAMSHSVYYRCQIDSEVFHSVQYNKAKRQNNSVALLDDNRIFIIDSFVLLTDTRRCYAFGNFTNDNSRQKLCDKPLPHFRVLKREPESVTRCIPVDSIASKLLSFTVCLSENESLRVACVDVLQLEMLS
jgi:hypothetical protein